MKKILLFLLVAIATIGFSIGETSAASIPLPETQQQVVEKQPVTCEYWYFYPAGSAEDKAAINSFLSFYKKGQGGIKEYRKVFMQLRKTSYFRTMENLFDIEHDASAYCATKEEYEFSWFAYYSLYHQMMSVQ